MVSLISFSTVFVCTVCNSPLLDDLFVSARCVRACAHIHFPLLRFGKINEWKNTYSVICDIHVPYHSKKMRTSRRVLGSNIHKQDSFLTLLLLAQQSWVRNILYYTFFVDVMRKLQVLCGGYNCLGAQRSRCPYLLGLLVYIYKIPL